MMNKFLLIIGLSFLFVGQFSAQNDSIQRIKISKSTSQLYQGVDSLLSDWYFYVDKEKIGFLANLNIPIEKVGEWFELRKNSDNIFKSKDEIAINSIVFLTKNNEPETQIVFEIIQNDELLKLVNLDNGEIYIFRKINIH